MKTTVKPWMKNNKFNARTFERERRKSVKACLKMLVDTQGEFGFIASMQAIRDYLAVVWPDVK